MSEKLLYLLSSLASRLINAYGHPGRSFSKILVIKEDEIGDMVTSLHVFYHLNRQFPQASIALKCKGFNRAFFEYVPYVQIVDRLGDAGPYDLIVDLRGDYKSLMYSLTHWPKYRLDRGTVRMRNKFSGGQKNELDTNFEIIRPVLEPGTKSMANTIRTSEREEQRISWFLSDQQIGKYILLHLGAREASRRWPLERYQSIMDRLISQGFHCLLIGGPSDSVLNQQCLSPDKPLIMDVAGKFNLLEFSVLCSKAQLFIGNESGPLHIAAANNTPLIGLYGPGVKDVFYPRSSRQRIHHYFLNKGHKNQTLENSTIFKITVDEVQQSVDALLSHE